MTLESVASCVTVDDFEVAARARLSAMAYDYYQSGADEEHTLHRNRDAWTTYELWYRALVDVSTPRVTTSVLGTALSSPILVAPTAYHCLADVQGECATARAAGAAGTLYVASTLATTTLEDVAAAAPTAPRWFQLYVHKDRDFTAKLVERAKAAGYGAIVVTCDTPVLGRRCADVRNGFRLPTGMVMANLIEILPPDLRDGSGSELARFVASRHDASFTWKQLAELADACAPLPLVVKGIVRGDDARAALDHGARAVWVSNHGGRQLDLSPATADGLVEVVAAVAQRAEVYVDGGIRSGTHALVALGLGARAVFVGRPVLWGLAAGGEAGVVRVLGLLHDELVRAMQLAGCADVTAVNRDIRPPLRTIVPQIEQSVPASGAIRGQPPEASSHRSGQEKNMQTLSTTEGKSAAKSTTWTIDASHSTASFSVRHLMITNVRGEFGKVAGTVTYDPAKPEATAVSASVDVSSISTREAQRDAHLLSADFFDVEKFPAITFASKAFRKGDRGLELVGDLTIRDVTREVVLLVDGPTAEQTNPWGNTRIGASAHTKIKRSDFGMTWNTLLEAGGVVVGDEITITIDVSLIRQK